MHAPTSRPSKYLEVGVDGRDLGGAAGGHTGLDDLNRRVGGRLLQGRGSCVCLSVARQPAGTAAHLQGVWGRAGRDLVCIFIFCTVRAFMSFRVQKIGKDVACSGLHPPPEATELPAEAASTRLCPSKLSVHTRANAWTYSPHSTNSSALHSPYVSSFLFHLATCLRNSTTAVCFCSIV